MRSLSPNSSVGGMRRSFSGDGRVGNGQRIKDFCNHAFKTFDLNSDGVIVFSEIERAYLEKGAGSEVGARSEIERAYLEKGAGSEVSPSRDGMMTHE